MTSKSFFFAKLELTLFLLFGITTTVSAAPLLLNTSFEINNVAPSSFLYAGAVAAEPWLFERGAGISGNYSSWSGLTNSGDYFAFLQSTASVSQTFISDGDYKLDISFDMVERSGYSPNQIVEVWFDGTLQTSINPGDNWSTYSLNDVAIGTGSYTLEFRGITTGEDTSVFLDNIQMTASSAPEPGMVSLLGVGLLPWIIRRRSA
ncbi:MAG: hypothetical protein HGA97_03145 [Chlorobiaceae bacterium]|jgi:hypothetical protein|nr:hypothetical protein [Chlorobiaceae bacterium]